MHAQGYWVQIENAKPPNSALSLQKTEELGFTRLAQPCYFPDLAPYDFFLFGFSKKKLHGKKFRSQNQMMSVMRAF
jgi:hypothetical protein